MWFIQLRGLYWREVLRFLTVPYQTIANSIVMSTLYFFIFGVSMGRAISINDGFPYLAFLIPGMVALSGIRNSFENSTSTIIAAKYMNELQDIRVTPLSFSHITIAQSCASLTRGLIVSFFTYVMGSIFYLVQTGSLMPIVHPFLLLYFLCIGCLSFGALGLAIAMYSSSFERVNSFSSFILVPLIYLGGVFFDLNTLDPFWGYVSKVNPLFYLINGIRYSFIGTTDVSIGLSASLLGGFFIASFAFAYYSLRDGARYHRY